MQCPIDGAELAIAERSGVEIDYCPKCRGVWLDRGELDKIIERAAPEIPAAQNAPAYGGGRQGGYGQQDGHGQPPARNAKASLVSCSTSEA